MLILDSSPQSCVPLSDHLRQQGHRCTVQANARGALQFITTATADRWPKVALIRFPVPDCEGLEIIHLLRERHPTLGIVAYADLQRMPGPMFEQAERLGIHFLPVPLILNRVDAAITDAADAAQRRQSAADQPFFGTTRIIRTGRHEKTDHYAPAPAAPAQVPGQSSSSSRRYTNDDNPFEDSPTVPPPVPPLHSITRSVTRTPLPADPNQRGTSQIRMGSERFFQSQTSEQAPPITGEMSTTSRIRRSVTGRTVNPALAQPPAAAPPPASLEPRVAHPQTHAVARPVAQSVAASAQRTIACLACGRHVVVAIKPAAYSVPCLGCGALNRVEPH